ncbi:S8/S53 family peptidase, partial [bacterium]|nr:S8/S53 family peptidase [bacterium]
QIIDDRDLHVIISWFEPPVDPGTGNAMASFFFRYEPVEFASVDDAVTYFSGLPLAEGAWGNTIHNHDQDYTQGNPDDYYYEDERNKHINILGIDNNPNIDWGPPFGDWITDITVAVIDDGVYRDTQDFAIPGCPPNYKKISWCGLTCDDVIAGYPRFGYGWGAPTEGDRNRECALVKHGTQVAGTITACTNNLGWGSAGVAPQIGVLPVRLRLDWDSNNTAHPTTGSFIQSIVMLRKCLPSSAWVEDVRVANFSNSSYSSSGVPSRYPPTKWIYRDIIRCDRLWVAAAGNNCRAQIRFPAALPPVLGISALYTNSAGDSWYPYLGANGTPIDGSTWFADQEQSPNYRRYQVSGIYGIRHNSQPNLRLLLAYLPATPIDDQVITHYHDFFGTSFATPQVAGLAALLFDRTTSASYLDVLDRIVSTRRTDIEDDILNAYGIPLAGPVDFEEALNGWD